MKEPLETFIQEDFKRRLGSPVWGHFRRGIALCLEARLVRQPGGMVPPYLGNET